jgi:hypothetical protein
MKKKPEILRRIDNAPIGLDGSSHLASITSDLAAWHDEAVEEAADRAEAWYRTPYEGLRSIDDHCTILRKAILNPEAARLTPAPVTVEGVTRCSDCGAVIGWHNTGCPQSQNPAPEGCTCGP